MRRLFLVFILVLAAVPLLANGGGASSNTREFSGGTVSYFAANEGEIWRTDGTPEGTRFFAAAAAGQYAMLPIPYQGKVIFFGAAMSPRGTDVYVSDGAATRRIASIDALWGPLAVTLFRDRVYFATEAVYSGEKARLWVTDGTAAGTEVVAELGESTEPALVAADERLFVSVYEEGDDLWSESIWASDGTTAGTSRIAEGLQQYPPITRVGEVVLFYGEDRQVWRSDGTAEGTYALGGESFVTGGTAAWILDCEGRLFRSDGSAAGTVEVWDFLESVQLVGANETGKVFLTWWGSAGAGLIALDPAARAYVWLARETTSGMRAVAAIGETLYFTTDRPELGQELWRSDGTAAGTGVVRDIAPGAASSYPSDFTRAGDRLLFRATDRQSGYEPWVTDGTTAGTRMLANIAPEAMLDGRITDAATGAPVAGASVSLGQTWHDSSSENYVTTVTSDAAGRYVIRNLEKGTYRITVTTATHLAQSSSTFDVGSGASVTVDLALRRGATITGRVIGADGAPVAAIPVEVGAVFGTAVVRTQTDADGRYVAGGVPAGGPWLVWTAGDQYSQVIYQGVSCLAGCNAASRGTEIVLAEGEVRAGVDFTVAPRGRIRGKLIDAVTGVEPEYSLTFTASIYGFRAGEPVDLEHPAFIHRAGKEFDLAVPDGTYHLLLKWSRSVRDTYQWTWYPNAPCTTCAVAEGAAVTPLQDPAAPGYVFVLTPNHGYVTGRVVDARTGAPLEGIGVYLMRSPMEYAGGATTRADGTFHVPAAAGTYSIRVHGRDTHAGIADAGTVTVRTGAVSAIPELRLHRRPDIEVRVIDAVTQEHLVSNVYPIGEPGERELTISYTGWRPEYLTVATSYDDHVELVVPLLPACDVTVAEPPLLPGDGGPIALRVDAACSVCPIVRGLPYFDNYIRCIPAGGGELRFTLTRNPSADARTGTLILPGLAIPLTQEGFRRKTRAARH